MKILISNIGNVDPALIQDICEGLTRTFFGATCKIENESPILQEKAFDEKRRQYLSNVILREIQARASKHAESTRILGLANFDLFVPGLNFVFGEATCPGRAALISLWRLKPEFYGQPPDAELLLERSLKEAVHELGHTLGLRHCSRPSCVMHFSNQILDTDKKQTLFCDQCYSQIVPSTNHNWEETL
jgi:archaemetzincin